MKLKFDINRESLFEKYLNNELSEHEVEQFHEALENDKRLKEDFILSKDIHTFFKNERRQILKQSLVDLEAKNSEKFKFIKLNWYKISSLVACLCGVIFFGHNMFKADHNSMYSDHFTVYPNVEIVSLRSNEIIETLDSQMMSYYDAQDYNQTIKLFEKNGVDNKELLFFVAIGYMEIGNISNAKKMLLNIPDHSKYFEKSKWYLSLCYLNENNIKEYSKVVNTLTYKRENAEQILEALD